MGFEAKCYSHLFNATLEKQGMASTINVFYDIVQEASRPIFD